MNRNIGTRDRILRLAIALVLLGYACWYHSWLAAVVGFFTLYEAVAGWCILYQLLGKNSCPINQDHEGK